jgi:hypothetical protein
VSPQFRPYSIVALSIIDRLTANSMYPIGPLHHLVLAAVTRAARCHEGHLALFRARGLIHCFALQRLNCKSVSPAIPVCRGRGEVFSDASSRTVEDQLKSGVSIRFIFIFLLSTLAACTASAQRASAPEPQTATIVGTVTDLTDDIVTGATVMLQGPDSRDQRTTVSNENGFFTFNNLKPGVPYHVSISAKGFVSWNSQAITLKPGQYLELPGVRMQLAVVVTTVTAAMTTEQIATQQVEIEEKQRVLGFIPNFYVVYDEHPAPLTAKLKFRLAFKTSTDPITILGSAFVAAVDQAGDTPDYGQGWKAYGQRFGANYANGLTDIFIGGAILPSLLHQDPRYYYKGTGTTKQRTLYALASTFRTKGDNGKWQPNYSGLGGYLASGAISNLYYPESNRGLGQTFSAFGIDVAADMTNALIQEFLLKKLTPSANKQH